MRTLTRSFVRAVLISCVLVATFFAISDVTPAEAQTNGSGCKGNYISNGYLNPSNHAQCWSSESRKWKNSANINGGYYQPVAGTTLNTDANGEQYFTGGTGIETDADFDGVHDGGDNFGYCIDPGGSLPKNFGSNKHYLDYDGALTNKWWSSASGRVNETLPLEVTHQLAYVLSEYGQPFIPDDPSTPHNDARYRSTLRDGTPVQGVDGTITVMVAVYNLMEVPVGQSSSARNFANSSSAAALVAEAQQYAGPYSFEIEAPSAATVHDTNVGVSIRLVSATGTPMPGVPVESALISNVNQSLVDNYYANATDPELSTIDHPTFTVVAPSSGTAGGVTNADGYLSFPPNWNDFGRLFGGLTCNPNNPGCHGHGHVPNEGIALRAYQLPATTINLHASSSSASPTSPTGGRQRIITPGPRTIALGGAVIDVINDTPTLDLQKIDAVNSERLDGAEFELSAFSDLHRIFLIGEAIQTAPPSDNQILARNNILNNPNNNLLNADGTPNWNAFAIDWWQHPTQNPNQTRTDAWWIDKMLCTIWDECGSVAADINLHVTTMRSVYGATNPDRVPLYIANLTSDTRNKTRLLTRPYRDVLTTSQNAGTIPIPNGQLTMTTAWSSITNTQADLPSDTYLSVREVVAPNNYTLATGTAAETFEEPFVIPPAGAASKTVANLPYTGVAVQVRDVDTGLLVRNVPVELVPTLPGSGLTTGDAAGDTSAGNATYIVDESKGCPGCGGSSTAVSELVPDIEMSAQLGNLNTASLQLVGGEQVSGSDVQPVVSFASTTLEANTRKFITLWIARTPEITTLSNFDIQSGEAPILDLVTITNIERNVEFTYTAQLWRSNTQAGLANPSSRTPVFSTAITETLQTEHIIEQELIEVFAGDAALIDADGNIDLSPTLFDVVDGLNPTDVPDFLLGDVSTESSFSFIVDAELPDLQEGWYSWDIEVAVPIESPDGGLDQDRIATHAVGIPSETFFITPDVGIDTEAVIPSWKPGEPLPDVEDEITLTDLDAGDTFRIVSHLVGPFESEDAMLAAGSAGVTADLIIETATTPLITVSNADLNNGTWTGLSPLVDLPSGAEISQWFTWVTEVQFDDDGDGVGESRLNQLINNPVAAAGCSTNMQFGDLGRGVAAMDSYNDTAYLMYSDESVHTRFGGLNVFNADHFISVVYDAGVWRYDNNEFFIPFEPAHNDCLVAELDNANNDYTLFDDGPGEMFGIPTGYEAGDLDLIPDWWNGSSNNGEWNVNGTSVHGTRTAHCNATMRLGDLNFGVASDDAFTGSQYLMWSEEEFHTRVSSTFPNNADHLWGVRYVNGEWFHVRNGTLIPYTPAEGDCLLAEVNHATGTVNSFEGQSFSIHGIPAGYLIGNLEITPNEFNGELDTGEWGIEGTRVGNVNFIGADRAVVHNWKLESETESFPLEFSEVDLVAIKIGLDDSTIPLQGAVYELIQIVPDGVDVVIGEFTTDSNGEINVEVKPNFQYCFEEISAPDGYSLDGIPRCTSGLIVRDMSGANAMVLPNVPDLPCVFGDPDCEQGDPPTCVTGLPCTGLEAPPIHVALMTALLALAMIAVATFRGRVSKADLHRVVG